jgi:hypothetical protein
LTGGWFIQIVYAVIRGALERLVFYFRHEKFGRIGQEKLILLALLSYTASVLTA